MPELHDIDISPSWLTQFTFFDAHGLPTSSPASRAAYQALPFTKKIRIYANVPAFLFGPLYFLAKGMWRKGLTLLAALVAIRVALLVTESADLISDLAVLAFAFAAMSAANYAYYLHIAKGSRSWNPFEGFTPAATSPGAART